MKLSGLRLGLEWSLADDPVVGRDGVVPLEERLEGLQQLDDAKTRLRAFERSRGTVRVMLGAAIPVKLVLIAREVRLGSVDGSLAVLGALVAIPVLLAIVFPAEAYGRSIRRKLGERVAELGGERPRCPGRQGEPGLP